MTEMELGDRAEQEQAGREEEQNEAREQEEEEVHDTTPEDLKNFCATQACADSSDVVKLADSTLGTLNALWDEIGFAKHERDNAQSEMFADIKRVFEKKMSSTQEVKCSINSQIRLAKARISTVEAEVGLESSGSSMEEQLQDQSLRDSLAKYKEHLEKLEHLKTERSEVLDTRVKELTSLFLQLDDALNTEQTKFLRIVSDYTQNRIDVFDERIREVMEERSRRQASMDAEVASIQALWKELDVSDESKAQEQVDQWIVVSLDIKLTQANLELVTERHNDLEELKAKRSKESSECFETLDRLWDRLKTPEEERVEMRLLMSGLSQSTIQGLHEEIARLEVLKKEKMKELVGEAREHITKVWDDMRMSDGERRMFASAFDDVFTEESLNKHEEELTKAMARLEIMAPLIKIVERRDQIKEEEASMKAAQADPSRLLGRGRGMAEQLKREEKIRNMVSKELPRLTDKLTASIAEFEEEHGSFTLDGVRVIETLEEEAAAAALAKSESARNRGKTVSSSAASSDLRPKTPSALNSSVNKSSVSDRPSTAPTTATPGNRLKMAAKAVVNANKKTPGKKQVIQAKVTTTASKGDENQNPQAAPPPSLMQEPPSRLKAPMSIATKLSFEPSVSHVISPRTGKPKRMITPLAATGPKR